MQPQNYFYWQVLVSSCSHFALLIVHFLKFSTDGNCSTVLVEIITSSLQLAQLTISGVTHIAWNHVLDFANEAKIGPYF